MMKICAVIPAAGASRRFGNADKLTQDLGGRPLLIRTVEAFAKHDLVTSVIVAGPPDSFEEFRERFAATLSFHGAAVVAGGSTDRWETVRNALASVPDDATHIAVHDAARPAVTDNLLDRVFEAARTLRAVIPAIPVSSTIKRVNDAPETIRANEDDAIADLILGDAGRVDVDVREVIETVDRRNLVLVQTPQVFERDLLMRAYAQHDPGGATDDASLVERLGEQVHVVEGDVCNIKVTTPDDLRLVRAILGVKPPAERPVHKQF